MLSWVRNVMSMRAVIGLDKPLYARANRKMSRRPLFAK